MSANAEQYLSPNFPTRADIRRAAQLDSLVTHLRARNMPVPPSLVREAQHMMATFRNLEPHEQVMVGRTFNADLAAFAQEQQNEIEMQQANAAQAKTDNLVRELTKNFAGRPAGLTMEIAAALRAGDKVHVRTKKLPTGAAADARVQAHTGMNLKQYEKLLDAALEARNLYRYNDEAKYQQFIEKNFPGQSFKHVDRVVKNWAVEGAGLEIQRRAQKDTPDTVTIRADAETQRRLAVIESIAEVEVNNPRSPFQKDQRDRLHEIAAERNGRSDDLRASIAEAFLANGADSFDVEVGPIRDHASDEIVGVEDDND